MANKSKAKGTKAETSVVNWLRARGLDARRVRQKGSKDEGDIEIIGYRVVIESKWTAATPTSGMVDRWLGEAEIEAGNVSLDRWPMEHIHYVPVLVHNRQRCTDVAEWIWYVWSVRERGFIRTDGWGFKRRIEDDFAYLSESGEER